MTKRSSARLFAATSLAIASAAKAQSLSRAFFPNDVTFSTPFPTGYTHVDSFSVAIFGYTNLDQDGVSYDGPTSPTITFANGYIDAGFLEVWNDTTIVMSGSPDHPAAIFCPINFMDSATITLNDNNVLACGIAAHDDTTVTVNGGSIGGDPSIHASGLIASGHANATINGGQINGDAAASQSALLSMNGGTVAGGVHAYDTSIVSIAGGNITGTLSADGSAPTLDQIGVALSAGTVASAAATNQGLFTMTGGTITGDLNAANLSTVQLNSGTITGTVQSHDSATVTIDGATVGNAICNDSSAIFLSSGTINCDATSHGGFVDIQNAHIAGNVIVDRFGFVLMQGGQIDQNVQVHDSAAFDMSGGTVTGNLTADTLANAELDGGTIIGGVMLNDGSVFSINGCAIGSNLIAHGTGTTAMRGGSIAGSASFFDSATFVWTGGTITGGVFMHGSSTLVLGASTVLNSGITLNDSSSLALAPGSGAVLRTATLHVNPGAKLDLADNKLIVPGGDVGHWNGTQYTGIAGLVQAGRNGGTWDGNAIVTSMPHANGSGALNTLAVATAGDVHLSTFGGLSVAPSDVLVAYTFAGDADLTGSITGDDFFRIDQGFASQHSATPLLGYTNGDFNYDGRIDADDYFLIDNGYAMQNTNLGEGSGPPLGRVTGVPEPGATGLFALAASLLLRCRRRDHQFALPRAEVKQPL